MYAERERIYKSKELYTQALAEFRKIGDLGSAEIILARLQDLETSPGVSVVEVRKASAADRAGIVPGDLIIEYAGETGFRVQGFKQLVNDYARMDKVTLSVMNGGQIVTLVVPGGPLGVAVEDIKRPPRPRPPREERRGRDDRRRRGRDRDRR
jgi:S1-C subfamily serine protease